MSAGLMAQDMAEQPAVLAALVARRDEILESLAGPAPAGIVIVARGSSDHAGIFGRYLLEAATGLPVALAAPSLQTLYGVRPRVEGWLAVGISQSGRTPEIATVLERFREAGARAVAVTNDPDSPLARGASVHVSLGAGEERAVPATKTFTAQLAAMALVAEALGPLPFGAADWERLPGLIEEVLGDPAPAERVADAARRRGRARLRRTWIPHVRGARGRAQAARGGRGASRGLVRRRLPPRTVDGRRVRAFPSSR